MKRVGIAAWFLCALGTLVAPGDAHAAGAVQPYQEYSKLIRVAEQTEPLTSDLFGESINLYNGQTEFSNVDIDIPGNGNLPVQLRRRLSIAPLPANAIGIESFGGFGNWDIDVPFISGVFDAWYGWEKGSWGAAARCSSSFMPATSAPFIQARYYDPDVGRFLSVDPVAARPVGDNFNRYWYANNSPYRFSDPDGREVRFAWSNGATALDVVQTMAYLSGSKTFAREFSVLMRSQQLNTISFDRTTYLHFDEQFNTVHVNPESGLRVRSTEKIQSPALGAGHEISHAAEYDRIGKEQFLKNLDVPSTTTVGPQGEVIFHIGISSEEARATRVESKMARELGAGDQIRRNYNDHNGEVKTCRPTSTKEC